MATRHRIQRDGPLPLTERQYHALLDTDTGICKACGAERGNVEPDAHCYPCEDCGEEEVCGLEELLACEDINIVSR